MNSNLLMKLDEYIRERLTEKRYRHTQGVVETAVALAKKHGADVQKAHIAALFHDACKNLDIEEMNALVEQYQIGEVYIDKPQLAHSKLAAAIIQDRFGVADEDIVNAISYHTTGRAHMSLLEMIVYVADATEPNRTYKDAARLNALAFEDLEQACFEVAQWSLKIIQEEGRYLDEDTIRARDWFASLQKGKSMENSRVFAEFAAGVLDDKQGRDIVIMDIAEKSSFADYFVISTGGSERLINALAEHVEEKAAARGRFVRSIEGRNGTGWILMDYGDVVINIFSEENRQKYNLEKIWSDCEILKWEA
ncbi:MAG: bis(5'-nucleosyl)-tetraphosphatase (symmetrical) YqeK [Anaerovoracaceae bacterium]